MGTDLKALRLGQLRRGVVFLYGSEFADIDADRIGLSSGTTRASCASSAADYKPTAYVPTGAWRAPGERELALLRGEFGQDGNWVRVVRIPSNLLSEFEAVRRSIAEASSLSEARAAAVCPLSEIVLKRLATWTIDEGESLAGAGISVNLPGLPTVTDDQADGRFLGLHLDTWYHSAHQARSASPSRISINLGYENRYFLYANLCLADMQSALELTGNSRDVSSNQSPRSFYATFPRYPIVRLRVGPGEAYIAPTENISHDGSSMGQTRWDASFVIRGQFCANDWAE